MTEAEWLTSDSSATLLDWLFFDAVASDRKLRLFSVACCSLIQHLVRDKETLQLLKLIEECADGKISESTLLSANSDAEQRRIAWRDGGGTPWNGLASIPDAQLTCWFAAYPKPENRERVDPRGAPNKPPPWSAMITSANILSHGDWTHGDPRVPTYSQQADWLRDIFGNPFRPVAFDAAWRTDTALSLARHMYESRDFSAMPILADALQDAGCDHDDILNHCRDTIGVHVRGCWVVDLVLGKV